MPLFFTHIPKTAGTSFKKGVIFPNVPPEKILRYNGMMSLVRERRKPFDFLDGHYPYGVHRFGTCETPITYVTILREPLERAVSHYYFIKQCDTSDYQHPNLADAKRWNIGEFYTLQKYQNLQTKFTAGFAAMKLAALLPRARFGALLLAQAKYNLSNKYHFFGFTEQMDEFEKMVAEKLGWRHLSLRDDTKVTRNRPSLDAIAEDARASILQGNLLDIELYSFAQKLFAERLERNGRGDAIHSAR